MHKRRSTEPIQQHRQEEVEEDELAQDNPGDEVHGR